MTCVSDSLHECKKTCPKRAFWTKILRTMEAK